MKDIIQKLLDETSLETKLRILNEMYFIDLLTKLGYREDKMWTDSPEDDDKLRTICTLAKDLANTQLKEIKRHKNDIND